MRDWSRFKAEPEQQKRILGCAATDSDNWALLGNMLGFAIKPVFGNPETVGTIERTVKSTLARDAVFPETAASAHSSLTALDGIGPGIATRLLTLARPDRCASWNDASRRGLAAYTTPDSARSSNRDSYGNLLRRIYKQPWFFGTAEPLRKSDRGGSLVHARRPARRLHLHPQHALIFNLSARSSAPPARSRDSQ